VAFRFVDDEDIVTKIPLLQAILMSYGVFLDNKGVLFKSKNFLNWWRSCSESVAIRSSGDADKYRIQNPGGISDHNPAYYVKYLYQNLQKKGEKPFKDYLRGL